MRLLVYTFLMGMATAHGVKRLPAAETLAVAPPTACETFNLELEKAIQGELRAKRERDVARLSAMRRDCRAEALQAFCPIPL